MKKLFFSVIIPTYRDPIRLNICLKALNELNFDKNQFEVIIVNNDPAVLMCIDDINAGNLDLKVLNERQPGSYAARNLGIKHAKGKIIAFTDSDCIPDRQWLKNAKKHFDQDQLEEIGIIAGHITLFYQNAEKLNSAEIFEKHTAFKIKDNAKRGFCVTANWFSYKKCIEHFEGFDAKLKSNGDNKLSQKFFDSQKKILYAEDVLVLHPARRDMNDLVKKFRRVIGGTYTWKYKGRPIAFFFHVLFYSLRLMKTVAVRFITAPMEALCFTKASIAIALGIMGEYTNLIVKQADTKR